MKKWLLGLSLLTLLAAPAFAYESVRHTPQPQRPQRDGNATGEASTGIESLPRPTDVPTGDPGSHNNGDDNPTRPVPEPGTMVLASMGLIAMGAAARKRRGN